MASWLFNQRGRLGGLHHHFASGYADLQPGGRNLHLGADGDHQRRDAVGDDLLHHQRHHADHRLDALHRSRSRSAATETLEAIAVASGDSTSAVGSAAYTITPTQRQRRRFSPAAGTYTSAQTVTISTTTPSATIYYTTNGTTPTTSSASLLRSDYGLQRRRR